MDKRGLLFIPDISGFTRFVTEMEIDHSRHIIQQLLEVLIDANELGLEISEIEGDAILFYRYGESPDLNALYGQIERMFRAFHRHLVTYEYRRLCQCKACMTAVDLSLKVVTHYGEFTGYNVKTFSKLIGKDVIVAHQLLKNDIAQHEYWLVTDGLLSDREPAPLTEWMEWDVSAKKTESGKIPFHFTQLGRLKNGIIPEPTPELELAERELVLSSAHEYEADIKTMFYSVGHFELRHLWMDGIKEIDEVDHYLPGVGTRHRCVMNDGTTVVRYTSGFSFDPESRIVYGETDEDKTRSIYFVLDKLGDRRTRFTIELYVGKDPVLLERFNLAEKESAQLRFERSLQNLVGVVKDVKIPVEF